MQAQTLAAVASSAAVIMGFVNVGTQAFFARRTDKHKWLREKLPAVIEEFNKTLSELGQQTFFKSDELAKTSPEERQAQTSAAFLRTMGLLGELEMLASPKLLKAADDLVHAIVDWRDHLQHSVDRSKPPTSQERQALAEYSEARRVFLGLARKEIGLKPVPAPRKRRRLGLARRSRD